jgi:RNA polymerase sigma-70 factor (ECF subfamily)
MAEFDREQVIRDHLRGVWRYLRVIGCDPATADDLTQETFLVFLRKPFDYLGHEPTAAYLRQVARLAYLELARKQAKQTPPADVDEVFEEIGPADNGNAYVDALGHCLDALQPKARECIELRYREKLSREEIATRLGMKETGVKTLLQRAREALRECIERRVR